MTKNLIAAALIFAASAAHAALPSIGTQPGQTYIVRGSTVAQASPLIIKSTSTTGAYKILEVLNNAGTSLFSVAQNGYTSITNFLTGSVTASSGTFTSAGSNAAQLKISGWEQSGGASSSSAQMTIGNPSGVVGAILSYIGFGLAGEGSWIFENVHATGKTIFRGSSATDMLRIHGAPGGPVEVSSAPLVLNGSGANAQFTGDANISRVSAGVLGIGTGAAGSVAGTISAAGIQLNAGGVGFNGVVPAQDGIDSDGTNVNYVVPSAGTHVFSDRWGIAIAQFSAANATINGALGSTKVSSGTLLVDGDGAGIKLRASGGVGTSGQNFLDLSLAGYGPTSGTTQWIGNVGDVMAYWASATHRFYVNATGSGIMEIESDEIKANAPFTPWSRTRAQIDLLVPERVGQYIHASDTTLPGLCVSTGTAAAQWRKVESATLGCGTNN